jgi:hypothetical protein
MRLRWALSDATLVLMTAMVFLLQKWVAMIPAGPGTPVA